jgi:hypothetical protein
MIPEKTLTTYRLSLSYLDSSTLISMLLTDEAIICKASQLFQISVSTFKVNRSFESAVRAANFSIREKELSE